MNILHCRVEPCPRCAGDHEPPACPRRCQDCGGCINCLTHDHCNQEN